MMLLKPNMYVSSLVTEDDKLRPGDDVALGSGRSKFRGKFLSVRHHQTY